MQTETPITGNQVLDLFNQLEATAHQLTQLLDGYGHVAIWETVRRRAEKGALTAMLELTNGNMSEAALRLGVNRNTLSQRAESFSVNLSAIRGGTA